MTLILELPEGKEAVLRARAEACGVSAEQYAQQILDRDLEQDGDLSISAMFRRFGAKCLTKCGLVALRTASIR